MKNLDKIINGVKMIALLCPILLSLMFIIFSFVSPIFSVGDKILFAVALTVLTAVFIFGFFKE